MRRILYRTRRAGARVGGVMVLLGLLLAPWAREVGQPSADAARAMADLRALFARGNSPSERELQALERRHPNTSAAALARVLRGYRKYTAREYAAAVEVLTDPLIPARTKLGDYALYYAAKSLQALGRTMEAEAHLVKLWQTYPDSILARSALLEAARSALARGEAMTAIARIAPLAEAGDASALLLQAEGYEKLGQTERAIRVYERIYFDLPPTRESASARDRLRRFGVNVEDVARYGWERVRGRADRLYEAGAYEEAARAYRAAIAAFPEAARDATVLVRFGVSLLRTGAVREANTLLARASERAAGERQAEALYFLAESERRLGRTTEYVETTRRAVERHPRSPWTARALLERARFHMRNGERSEALAVCRQVVSHQPDSEFAPEAFWMLGWEAYRSRAYEDASHALLLLVARHPRSELLAQAAYWAARAEERMGRNDRAALLYEKIWERYRDAYYGQLARQRRERLNARGIVAPWPARRQGESFDDPVLASALANLRPIRAPEETAGPRTLERVAKAVELRTIRLDGLALGELTAAQREAPTSPRVCLELARLYRDQGDPLAAINALRQAHPDYAAYRGDEVSEEVFRLLFPLTHWDLIRRNAQAQGLDPYLVAGVIRQESGFHPRARSVANARGLMQVIPSTGRLVARRYGLRRLSPEQLYDPALNIRLGTTYLAEQVRRFGRIEYALAAYNAGPVRVARWLRELPTEEMDEWIESIPITETRQYVKSILRNVAHYRRIYGAS